MPGRGGGPVHAVSFRNGLCVITTHDFAETARVFSLLALSGSSLDSHNNFMERPNLQMSLAGLLGLVACIALNIWLFRLGALWGILGLNVTKHVAIAFLCQSLGVDRAASPPPIRPASAPSPEVPIS